MARKSGSNFKSFEHELARRAGVKNPDVLAASIGRAKSGEMAPSTANEVNLGGRRRNQKP